MNLTGTFRTMFRSLQAAQLELERQRATDSLRKNLEKRPEREELVERTASKLSPSVLLFFPHP